MWLARAGRYGRAGARWARLLDQRPPGSGRARLLRPRRGARRPASPSRAAPRSSSGWRPGSRTTRPTSRSSTSARRGCRATFARCSGTRGGARSRSSSTRTASATRAGRGATRRTFNRPLRTRARRGRARPLPERVLQAGGGRVRRPSRRARGRSSTTRSTSRHFTPAEQPPEGGPVLLLGGDQYQAYRLELGLETLAALLPSSTRTRSSSSRGGS